MRRNDNPRTLLFKAIIAAGVMLGMVMLAQTIWSYVYVSQNMVLQEAHTAAMRRAQAVAAATRDVDPKDSILLNAILEDRLDEAKDDVAWIQVFDARGKVLASVGTVPKDRLAAQKRAASIQPPPPLSDISDTDAGRVAIARAPLIRPARGAPRAAPQAPQTAQAEVAVYIDSVTQSFTFLLRYLVLGVSASLVLMGSLIFIAVRFNRYVRGQQIEGQLELARSVQADMLPVRSKSIGRVDFAVDCIAAWDVGGDFCDVFHLGNNRVAFVLGDVSGKGISAALLMALIHGAIQSMSWSRSKADHEQASRSLNSLLCRKTATERFASLFWGYFEPESSMLHYVNAGHPPPLLLRRDKDGKTGTMRLESGGPVLGLLPEGRYQQGEQAVASGDLLIAFSDGIVEAPSETGSAAGGFSEFGEQRLIAVVRDHWDAAPEAIRDAVLASIRAFIKGAPLADDQTLIVARFK